MLYGISFLTPDILFDLHIQDQIKGQSWWSTVPDSKSHKQPSLLEDTLLLKTSKEDYLLLSYSLNGSDLIRWYSALLLWFNSRLGAFIKNEAFSLSSVQRYKKGMSVYSWESTGVLKCFFKKWKDTYLLLSYQASWVFWQPCFIHCFQFSQDVVSKQQECLVDCSLKTGKNPVDSHKAGLKKKSVFGPGQSSQMAGQISQRFADAIAEAITSNWSAL